MKGSQRGIRLKLEGKKLLKLLNLLKIQINLINFKKIILKMIEIYNNYITKKKNN